MDNGIERVSRELKYSGSIVDVYSDVMRLPDGSTENWDYVAHRKGAAAVIPVMDNGNILMVRQYRGAIGDYTIEIPAGSRDSVTEPTIVCAARELEEETGYRSDRLQLLINVATTAAFCNEQIDIYVATDLVKTQQRLDAGEFVDVIEYTREDLVRDILNGTIRDGKTVSGILAYLAKFK